MQVFDCLFESVLGHLILLFNCQLECLFKHSSIESGLLLSV